MDRFTVLTKQLMEFLEKNDPNQLTRATRKSLHSGLLSINNEMGTLKH